MIHLEHYATQVPDTQDTWPTDTRFPDTQDTWPTDTMYHTTVPKPPLAYTNVYFDNFLTLAQGTFRRLQVIRRVLFEGINMVFWHMF